MKLPKFPVYKKKDGRKKPHCFSVPPPLAGDKEKFFYYETKKEAEEEAKKWREKFRRASAIVTLEGNEALEYYEREKTIKQAEEALGRTLLEILIEAKRVLAGIKHYRTVNETIERHYQKQKVRAKKEKIQMRFVDEQMNYLTRQFASYNNFGETLINELDNELIEDFWLDESTNNSKTYYSHLRQLFNYALSKQYILESPLFKFEDGDEDADINPLMPDQGKLFLENAHPRMLAMYVLQGWCGVRKSECLRLDFSDIVWQTKQVKIKKKDSKTKVHRLCDIEDAPFEWLLRCKGQIGPIAPPSHARFFTDDRVKLNMYETWSRNCLRHSCGTYHVANFRDKGKTSTMMGNSIKILEKHYDGVATSDLGLQWYNIVPSNESIIIDSSKVV